MDNHYNAFISYRHHPEDIRVATQIHRALERFHVPKALRRTAKLPLRLFRDKDELPITSNLSDDIFSALENSEYLIVICSVHTRESLWVQREIETFLKTHSRNRILTVLVSGEPYEVIPEILLYEDVADPETGELKRVPIEPLSCDWRMGHRKAVREELPRLAAALLHCGYDELRQRQRQYRMKQIVTAFSLALAASLALTAYFLYTSITIRNANIQIQKNLEQALENQSQHLATAAQELMDEGDRLTAMALLLEALPGEENQRPYVAEAEYVLTEALGVYSAEHTMAAQGALIPNGSAMVYDLALTENRDVIYLRDSRGMVTAWDTETLLPLSTIAPQGLLLEIEGTTPSSNVLLYVRDDQSSGISYSLQCYTPRGSLVWELKDYQNIAFSSDLSLLYVIGRTANDERALFFLDAETGAQTRQPLLLPDTPEGEYALDFAQKQIEENMPIPMVYTDWDDRFCLLDASSGEVTPLFYYEESLRSCCTTEDGKVVIMVSDGSGMWNGTIGNMNTTSPARSDIFCYDVYTGALLWQSEITTCQYTAAHSICPVPDTDLLLCQSGNTLQLIRCEDGSVLQYCDAATSITEISSVNSTYAFGILTDGTLFNYSYDINECVANDYNMEGNLKAAAIGGNVYTMALNSTQVTVYNFQESPTAWEYHMGQDPYSTDVRSNASVMVFQKEDAFHVFDLAQREILWQIPWEGRDLVDFSEDGTTLWIMDSYESSLICIDMQTRQMESYQIPQSINGNYASLLTDPKLIGGDFWYFLSYAQNLLLCRFSPEREEAALYNVVSTVEDVLPAVEPYAESAAAMETVLEAPKEQYIFSEEERLQMGVLLEKLPDFQLLSENARLMAVHNGFAWVMTGTGDLYELNLTEDTSTLRFSGLVNLPAWSVRESDGAVAVTAGQEIAVFIPGGEVLLQITLEEETPGALYFRGEELLALLDTGYLLRFDSSGNQLSRTGLTVNETFSYSLFEEHGPLDIVWQFTEDNELILTLFWLSNIIDCDTWGAAGFASSCFLYDEAAGQFVVRGSEGIRAYPRYSTEELIALAREELGSFQLSGEQREAYGIG